MAFIIVLCASTFVVFNAAAYLYLRPVKVGSAPFAELRMLLELQAQLNLPKSRFFPILSHIVSLMNPLLTGIDRQIQAEHLETIIVEYKDSLSLWQSTYSEKADLSAILGKELTIGTSMYVAQNFVLYLPLILSCEICVIAIVPYHIAASHSAGWPI
jgi:hypothetical protein